MEDGLIDISGLDKVELLRALYVYAFESPMSMFSRSEFDEYLAKEAVKKRIDYFQGRAIKTDLSRDHADPLLFDRDAGKGRFQQVVDLLRKKQEK